MFRLNDAVRRYQDGLDVSCIVIPQGAHGQYLMVKRDYRLTALLVWKRLGNGRELPI